jgi:hypothetical protein
MGLVSNVQAWFKAEVNGAKRYEIWGAGLAKAFWRGGFSGLSAVAAASLLDYSKFNLTNGLRSEFDLLLLVFVFTGSYAGYSYVKATSLPPK